jgi:hypothetical protein
LALSGKAQCSSSKGSTSRRYERKREALEAQYRLQSHWTDSSSSSSDSSGSDSDSDNKVTLLFGHVHHAGGTAFCQLARKNTIANMKDNCNHPLEFKGPPSAPTSGPIAQQLSFQRSSPWLFVSVELKMPQHLKISGPFIYGIILRNPYILLMSQYRRSQVKFQFKGDLIDLIHLQLKYVGITSVDYRKHIDLLEHERHDQGGMRVATSQPVVNYFRGQAGFLLGRFGPTNFSDSTIFNMAKRRLQRFSVIALTEFMVESGVVFGAKLNWNVNDFGRRAVNSNGDADKLVSDLKALSGSDLAFVRYYTRVDILLYQYAKCLLEKEHLRLTNRSLSSYPYAELDKIFS